VLGTFFSREADRARLPLGEAQGGAEVQVQDQA
jgi:hypothetical protein